jgi:hypothetical protein
MAALLELASGTVTTSDVAVITVPASQIWEVRSITIAQPSTGALKTFSLGRGTTATAANVKFSRAIPAGVYGEVIFIPLALVAAQTLNMVVSAGTTELTFTVQGYKTLLA